MYNAGTITFVNLHVEFCVNILPVTVMMVPGPATIVSNDDIVGVHGVMGLLWLVLHVAITTYPLFLPTTYGASLSLLGLYAFVSTAGDNIIVVDLLTSVWPY
jgi:hypothetical protein